MLYFWYRLHSIAIAQKHLNQLNNTMEVHYTFFIKVASINAAHVDSKGSPEANVMVEFNLNAN